MSHFAVFLKTKKPATRKDFDANSLLLTNIKDNLATHRDIIADFREKLAILGTGDINARCAGDNRR